MNFVDWPLSIFHLTDRFVQIYLKNVPLTGRDSPALDAGGTAFNL
jgi:hypothetical protein